MGGSCKGLKEGGIDIRKYRGGNAIRGMLDVKIFFQRDLFQNRL